MFGKTIKTTTLLSVLLICTVSTTLAHQPGPVKIISKSHGKLAASWWQHISSFPADENPLFEEGEVDCTRGQSGPVLFLAGADAAPIERSCTVPSKALFFPLLNLLYDNAPGEPPLTLDEKRVLLDEVMSDTTPGFLADLGFPGTRACDLFATLDGVAIHHFATIARAQSPPFELVTELDGFPSGADDPEAITDGFWILLPRLSRGDHVLRFGGRFCEFDTFADHPLFGSVDVTYHLTVE